VSIKIAAINKSTVVTDAELDLVCLALTAQRNDLLGSGWNDAAGATVKRYRSKPPSDAWPMYVVDDDPSVSDALGWHEATPNGDPIVYVLAGVAKRAGLSWSVTASHEFCEAVCDQTANEGVELGPGVWLANESCDPVEADRYGYVRSVSDPMTGRSVNVPLSDFVTRDWFLPDATGPFDFRGHLTSSLTLLPGGYAAIERNGQWSQVVANQPSPDGRRSRVEFSTRTPRRRAGKADWTDVPWLAVPAGVPLTADVIDNAEVMAPWAQAA
jgi:hypothetical protein